MSEPEAGGGPPADPLAGGIEDLLDALSAPESSFAGGAVAALLTAMAAELAAGSARRSEASWPEAVAAAAQAHALRLRVMPLAAADARAFAEAARLLAGPAAGEEGGRRDARLGRALARAADVPLEIAEVAADVAGLAAEVAAHDVAGARGDAVAAALYAEAAARVAAHLVEINLATTPDDARMRQAQTLAAAAVASAGDALAPEE